MTYKVAPSNLLARLAALRESEAAANPSPRSSENAVTPLRTFLTIYSKASRDCCINYGEGSKALYYWLMPIDWAAEEAKFPQLDNWRIPRLLGSWDLSELAGALSGQDSPYGLETPDRPSLAVHNKRMRLIALTLIELINEGVL